MSLVLKLVKEQGSILPFSVIKRNEKCFVKDREMYFIAAQQLKLEMVPVIWIEDEASFDRIRIANQIGPKENPLDTALRIIYYEERYKTKQTMLGEEFGVSQSMISRYFTIYEYLYPKTKENYYKALQIADQSRDVQGNPHNYRGAIDIGFRHLYGLTRFHHRYSGLDDKESYALQLLILDQITTKCLSVKNLQTKIKLILGQNTLKINSQYLLDDREEMKPCPFCGSLPQEWNSLKNNFPRLGCKNKECLIRPQTSENPKDVYRILKFKDETEKKIKIRKGLREYWNSKISQILPEGREELAPLS
jgi:hypothetical protein